MIRFDIFSKISNAIESGKVINYYGDALLSILRLCTTYFFANYPNLNVAQAKKGKKFFPV